jgi:hypothetical protein
MVNPRELPETHEWNERRRHDRLSFYCEDCDVYVPVVSNDTQAGILLYCPDCDSRMEYDWEWRNEEVNG